MASTKGIALTGAKMKGTVDKIAARELLLFIQNDEQLYRQEMAIDANLRKKLKRGVFDKRLAVKLFMYLADAGAAKYVQGYAHPSGYYTARGSAPRPSIDSVFNRKTRFFVAAQLARLWLDARRNEGVQINPPGRPPYFAAELYINNAPNQWVVMKRATPGSKHFNGEIVMKCKNEKEAIREAKRLNATVPWNNPISKRTAHRLVGIGLKEAERRGWISNPPSLYDKLRAAGAKIEHHESDLYVKADPGVQTIVRNHFGGSHKGWTFFRANDATTWIEVPFAYDPFWKNRIAR